MPRSMRRAAVTILGSLSLALSIPSAAAGQIPAPPPVPGTMSIKVENALRAGHDDVALRGDRVRIRGTVTPFVPGQRVVVRLYRGRAKVAARAAAVQPVPGRPNGAFVV